MTFGGGNDGFQGRKWPLLSGRRSEGGKKLRSSRRPCALLPDRDEGFSGGCLLMAAAPRRIALQSLPSPCRTGWGRPASECRCVRKDEGHGLPCADRKIEKGGAQTLYTRDLNPRGFKKRRKSDGFPKFIFNFALSAVQKRGLKQQEPHTADYPHAYTDSILPPR